MIDLSILLGIAKVSPFLALPILFGWIIWKINEKHNEFVDKIIADKNQHYTELITNVEKLSTTFYNKIDDFEKEVRDKQESHNENISTKISELATKIDSLRLELAWGDKK